ncbi:MAG: hypothetical protein WB586_20370 [Chthoniobacterales bacterium]
MNAGARIAEEVNDVLPIALECLNGGVRNQMPDLTTTPFPVPLASPRGCSESRLSRSSRSGSRRATARDKLGIDGKQLEAGYEIVRISEEEYREAK